MYLPGHVLSFANGMIGCVTKRFRLALVSPQGYATSARQMPDLDAYLLKNTVVKCEGTVDEDFQHLLAEAA